MVLLLLSFLLLFFVNKYNDRVDICLASYGNNIVLFYLGGILGSLCVFIISILQMRVKIFDRVRLFVSQYAQGTLLVVGFNLYAIYLAVKIYSLFRNTITPYEGVVIGTIVFFAFYPVILMCKRYFPQAIGMKR